jgi:hypothetical protein
MPNAINRYEFQAVLDGGSRIRMASTSDAPFVEGGTAHAIEMLDNVIYRASALRDTLVKKQTKAK